MENSVFVDTGWFKGLVDKKDEHHIRARNIFKGFKKVRQRLVTTNFVIGEAFTLIRKSCGMYWARKFSQLLSNLNLVLEIEGVMVGDERRVWDWFWHDWRELSYTDCASFAVMERLGIKKVATFDEHFAAAGFEVVK